MTFVACEKSSNFEKKDFSQVEFVFSSKLIKSSNQDILTNIIVTIEDLNGNEVISSGNFELLNMNGQYITNPISLIVGEYRLTGFLVLNDENEIIYASPIEGSPKAYLVDNPLPLGFSVLEDETVKVEPEVLSVVSGDLEDFGYSTFGFNIVNTFDFLVGAFTYNEEIENFELATAEISIYNDSELVYSGDLEAITNKISLPERYSSYSIVISKNGYITYSKVFTKEELSLHCCENDKGPLKVVLKKGEIEGLVAYYPFNSNANDESGHGNDGAVYGATLTTDRKGNSNSAYLFDGVDDYISVPNSPSLCPTSEVTVSGWMKVADLDRRQVLIDKRINFNTSPYNSYCIVSSNLNPQKWQAVVTTYSDYVWAYDDVEIEVNKWAHIVLRYDGSDISIFVNGSLKNSTPRTGDITYSNMDLFIGTTAQNTNFAKGVIDDIRIYDRALSDEEIQLLFNE